MAKEKKGGKGKEDCQILMRVGRQRERRVPYFNESRVAKEKKGGKGKEGCQILMRVGWQRVV